MKVQKGELSQLMNFFSMELILKFIWNSFSSTMIPPTAETLHRVLVSGGIPAALAGTTDPSFASLLEETRTIVMSPSFAQVLETSLDTAMDVLLEGLRKNVFPVESPEGGNEEKVRLAGLLPGLARWNHMILNALPNELADVSDLFHPLYSTH